VKHTFRTIAAITGSVMLSSLVPAMNADELDKKTNITIDQAINVQGTVLPAGAYVLKLLGSSPGGYTVQIFNARQNHIFATIFANPAYRLAGTSESEFKFYDGVAGGPPALRTWFYPGDNYGFEFRVGPGDVSNQSGRRRPSAPTSNAKGD
jgi:hypothetical protein